MEQFARSPVLSRSEKSSHLSLRNHFPRKGTLHISFQTLKNRFMTHKLRPANNPQVDRGSSHNEAISRGQANFVAAAVLWEPQRYTVPALSPCGNTVGVWGLHRPLLFVVCLPCYTSVVKSADETAEGGGVFAFPETAHETGQNKKSECRGSALASCVYVNLTVAASILSHRSPKIKVNKGGVTRLQYF